MKLPFVAAIYCLFLLASSAAELPRTKVEEAMFRAARFFREEVSVEGTYLWQYSANLEQREGEGRATKTQGWVQPPGTPSIGMAYLNAWDATTNVYFLDAARETAYGLIRGQLQSGGWQHSMELDPELRKKTAYRENGGKKGRNVTTFDDDTTQSALRFLMRSDAAFKFKDARIRDSVQYALTVILAAQHPNGAWSQVFERYPAPESGTVRKIPVEASFPPEWSRTWPGAQQYWRYYTLNDNNLATLVDTLFEAARIYENLEGDETVSSLGNGCRKAAERVGDFLILAQMPDPQPAWAQQYNFEMHPAWARKFEPPAISGGETQGALQTLIEIYRETGNAKYLEPIPKALGYLRKSRLPDGRLARFYELRSNRPLYFTRDYKLTYDDSDVPTHYSFKVGDRSDAIAAEYERVRNLPKAGLRKTERNSRKPSEPEIEQIVSALDERGRWIETGRLRSYGGQDERDIIRSSTFTRNLNALSAYLD